MILDYSKDARDQEQYAKECVKKRTLAAKAFRFVFKDVLDDLIFIRQTGVVGLRWTLCYYINHHRCQRFYAMGKKFPPFCMFIDFYNDELDRLDRYFPKFTAWKNFNGSHNDFSYKEFPLKTMIEAAIGETILHMLEEPFGDLCIYTYGDSPKTKQLFFKATNVEELMMKMDLEQNSMF